MTRSDLLPSFNFVKFNYRIEASLFIFLIELSVAPLCLIIYVYACKLFQICPNLMLLLKCYVQAEKPWKGNATAPPDHC
jgi:hypothetical protein